MPACQAPESFRAIQPRAFVSPSHTSLSSNFNDNIRSVSVRFGGTHWWPLFLQTCNVPRSGSAAMLVCRSRRRWGCEGARRQPRRIYLYSGGAEADTEVVQQIADDTSISQISWQTSRCGHQMHCCLPSVTLCTASTLDGVLEILEIARYARPLCTWSSSGSIPRSARRARVVRVPASPVPAPGSITQIANSLTRRSISIFAQRSGHQLRYLARNHLVLPPVGQIERRAQPAPPHSPRAS